MKKLPVLATIRDAYRFTFTHLGAIIGLIWLPMILVTVAGFFALQRFLVAYAAVLGSQDFGNMGPESLGLLVFVIVALLLYAMMSVPVSQLALGTRKEGALVYFSFTGIEWRLFRGIVALLGFMLVPVLVISALSGVVEAGALGAPNPAFLLLFFYLLMAILVYFGVRFGMLLPVLAVSETVPLLPRSWSLTAGNFWRLLAVAVAIFLPVEIVAALMHLAVAGVQTAMPQPDFSPGMAAAGARAIAMNMPLTSGINFLLAPVWLGLSLGAGASIYRALNGEKLP